MAIAPSPRGRIKRPAGSQKKGDQWSPFGAYNAKPAGLAPGDGRVEVTHQAALGIRDFIHVDSSTCQHCIQCVDQVVVVERHTLGLIAQSVVDRAAEHGFAGARIDDEYLGSSLYTQRFCNRLVFILENRERDAECLRFLVDPGHIVLNKGVEHQKLYVLGSVGFSDLLVSGDRQPRDRTACAVDVNDDVLLIRIIAQGMTDLILVHQVELLDWLKILVCMACERRSHQRCSKQYSGELIHNHSSLSQICLKISRFVGMTLYNQVNSGLSSRNM